MLLLLPNTPSLVDICEAFPRSYLSYDQAQSRTFDICVGQDRTDGCQGNLHSPSFLCDAPTTRMVVAAASYIHFAFRSSLMLLLTSLGQRGDLYGVQHHLYGALRVPQALSLVAPISSPTSFAPCVDECHFVAMQPDSGVDSMTRWLDFHKYIGVREQGLGERGWCVMSNRSVWTHSPTPSPFPYSLIPRTPIIP